MGRARLAFAVGLVCMAASRGARAYVPTVTASGEPVTWRGELKLNLAGNPKNTSGITPAELHAAVARSLQRWQAASGGPLSFDYWQGSDPSIYLPNSDYNGLSSLYFASNATADPHLSPNVLGLTQVWYDTGTGQILEADIVLNDKNFEFTTDPQDTSGFGSDGPTGSVKGVNKVYVENVLTHEIGHAFGLSHSGGLQSTMLFMESPEQAHLGCDDETAIHALYPTGDAGGRGAISGAVVSGGQPVFGAHVVAVSRQRGTVVATALTGASGRYRMTALEPGSYYLMVEPYFAGAAALPSYYASLKNAVCSGADFSRSFLSQSDGVTPVELRVGAGAQALAPDWTVRCNGDDGADVRGAPGALRASSAPEIFGGAGGGFGITEHLTHATPRYYRLSALSGHIEVHAVSYGLYSPAHVSLSLLDGDGETVPAQVSDPVYAGDSGYVNYDTALVADGLPPGNYTLVAQPSAVEAVHYPAGALALDSSSFMLLTGSVNEGVPSLSQSMPLNARCRMDENFASYSSPPGNPPRASTQTSGGGGGGFCGMVADSNRKAGEQRETSSGAMAGWLAPWLAMLAWARWAKRTAARRVKKALALQA
jgi:hypothetical protein